MGVFQVLNATLQIPNHFPQDFLYMNVSIEDSNSADIGAHLDPSVDFIHAAVKSKGRVFVHCVAGVSRSSTLVVAYLVARCRYRLDTALLMVSACACSCAQWFEY
jgi:protein-tyrosine phosphatase